MPNIISNQESVKTFNDQVIPYEDMPSVIRDQLLSGGQDKWMSWGLVNSSFKPA
jgi:hypothetical protein